MKTLGSWLVVLAVLALDPVAGPRSSDGNPGRSAARIVVKLRPSLATGMEEALDARAVSRGLASRRVRGFLDRHQIATLRPVYEARARARLEKGLTERQLSAETLRRFGPRARRRRGAFRPPDLSRTYTFQAAVDSPTQLASLVSSLARDPAVEYAEEDKVVAAGLVPDDPFYSSAGTWGQAYDDLYGLKKIGVETAWDSGAGEGVVVAVIDTGVDSTHPELANTRWTNPGEVPGNGVDDEGNGFVDDVMGWDFVGARHSAPAPDADPDDKHGHGTHVAGTIAAEGSNGIGVIGVAWQSKVMAVKGLDDNGYGLDSQLASAIVYAADNGADVINASFGGKGDSQTMQDAVDYAVSLGVVFVASAGNAAADARDYHPAGFHNVITVAATDADDQTAYFSNRGPKIDVGAPGVDILSLRAEGTSLGTPVDEAYTRSNGTSMASPHVAGLVAVVLGVNPTFTPEQVRQVLRVSATDGAEPGFDGELGYGRIDASQAVLVQSPLEARIQAPPDGSSVTGLVDVGGSAAGAGFLRYELAYGAGDIPDTWTTFHEGWEPVGGDLLGIFDAGSVSDGLYTVRLTAFDAAERAYVDRRPLVVDYVRFTNPPPPPSPAYASLLKSGSILNLEGTATGESFAGFEVQWARGFDPPFEWSDSGIGRTGGGQVEVVAAAVATWDTSTVEEADYYTLRLRVHNSAFTSEARTLLYVEPDLLSSHWPLLLRPMVWPGVGPHLAVGGAGERLLTAPARWDGGVSTLWRLSPDGSAAEALEVPGRVASLYHLAVADIDGQAGDETIVAQGDGLRVFRMDGTSYPFASGDPYHHVSKSLVVVEDLDGDSSFESLVVAISESRKTALLLGWDASGALLGGAFPVAVPNENPYLYRGGSRLVVADLDDDGVREIILADGPTPSTYSLRLLGPDGTQKEWANPVFEGRPETIAVADLDGDGTLEVLVLEVTDTQVLHVLGADGTPRPGWPVSLSGGEPGLAIVDVDRDGRHEVVVSAAYTLYLLNADGQPFSSQWPRSGSDYHGPPVAGDLDGDGLPEIVVPVFRNAWAPSPLFPLETRSRTEVATAEVLRPEGYRPAAQTQSPGSRLYHDHRLLALGSSGTVKRSWKLLGAKGTEIVGVPVPRLADIDGDGTTDIAVMQSSVAPGSSWIDDSVLTVFATGAPHVEGANDWPAVRHDSRNTSLLFPDGEAPRVAVVSPVAGATITGTITVSVDASDDVFVRGVQLQVDGVDDGAEDTQAPFAVDWDPRSSGNGPHVLSAVAWDPAGNRTVSAPVEVTVDIDVTPPQASITAPGPGDEVSGPLTVLADASDDRVVSRVELYVDLTLAATDTKSPYAFDWDPSTVTDGDHSLLVKAYDGEGNEGASDPVTIAVAVAPTVWMSAPAAGTTLSGATTLAADASDNTEVVQVDFLADGVLVGTDSVAPWDTVWDALAVPDGPYTLAASAHDAAGQTGTSPGVGVTVSHPPAVAITSPAAGAVVSTLVAVAVDASDAGGVERVELDVDGALVGVDTEAPYVLAWDPASHPDGPRSLVARAYDNAGNPGASTAVTATVVIPPAVALTSPAEDAVLTETVPVTAQASDNGSVVRVELYVDGLLAGTDTVAPWAFDLDTAGYPDGAHSLSAKAHDAAGNVGATGDIGVVLNNGGAVYDPDLGAPRCWETGAVCDSRSLLEGRGPVGPELNQPNTVNQSCGDGTLGSFHRDESNDRIRVSSLDGSTMTAGTTVQVEATVWAYSMFASDTLDLYYAADASSNEWTLIGSFVPTRAGAETITATYDLPLGSVQAVRARFRYRGVASPCAAGSYNDHDDLVFAVEVPPDVAPPTASITSPSPDATVSGVVTVDVSASDDTAVAKVELYVDGSLVSTDTTPPYSFTWDPATTADGLHSLVARAHDVAGKVGSSPSVPVAVSIPPTVTITSPNPGAVVTGVVTAAAQASDNEGVARVVFSVDGVDRHADSSAPYTFAWDVSAEVVGEHTLTATAYDLAGLAGTASPVTVQVPGVGQGAAAYDPVLRAPRCSGLASWCDSGVLLVGRATLGPEPNAPNTINDSCSDGIYGSLHSDESNDRIQVSTLDGTHLAEGKTVQVDASVWAYGGYSSDKLDLYYAADAQTPVWTLITTLTPSAAGAQVLSATYTLPAGGLQAVRARFRYRGIAAPCGGGSYNDHDDLVFEVE